MMETSPALAEAADWRLLGLLLERPRPGWIEELRALSKEVSDPELKAAAQAAEAATEGEYLAVFGPGGVVSPREVAYLGMGDPGRALADLGAFYRSFAYRPATEDPIDHVAVEVGFVGYMKLKEAFASGPTYTTARETTREALGRFLERHLRAVAAPLARRMGSGAPPHLAMAAAVLLARVGQGPEPLPVLEGEEDSPLCCPGEEGTA